MQDLEHALTTLGEKLDALELTSDEHNALMAIFETARGAHDSEDDDDVAGFTFSILTYRNYVPTFNNIITPQFQQLQRPLSPNVDYGEIQQNWGAIPPPMP